MKNRLGKVMMIGSALLCASCATPSITEIATDSLKQSVTSNNVDVMEQGFTTQSYYRGGNTPVNSSMRKNSFKYWNTVKGPAIVVSGAKFLGRANTVVGAGVTAWDVGQYINHKLDETEYAQDRASESQHNANIANIKLQAQLKRTCSVPRGYSARKTCEKHGYRSSSYSWQR